MAWRLIKVEGADEIDSDLTDSELIGVSIMLAQNSEPDDVYRRAWGKIQPQVVQAMDLDSQ